MYSFNNYTAQKKKVSEFEGQSTLPPMYFGPLNTNLLSVLVQHVLIFF